MTNAPFQQLRIWKEAHALALDIYRISKTFPKEEQYCLTKQIRRSATSVPANIAEGNGRNSSKETIYFLGISLGSLQETVQHCLIARDLNFADSVQLNEIIDRYYGLAIGVRRFMRFVKTPKK